MTVELSIEDHIKALCIGPDGKFKMTSLDELAKQRETSSRTIRRRLGENGTSFMFVVTQLRLEIMERLLVETDCGAGEIAESLGYSVLNPVHQLAWTYYGLRLSAARRKFRETGPVRKKLTKQSLQVIMPEGVRRTKIEPPLLNRVSKK